MTAFEEMSAVELRAELEDWHSKVCLYAREYRNAVQSGDVGWEMGSAIALDQALGQVRRIEGLFRLGTVA